MKKEMLYVYVYYGLEEKTWLKEEFLTRGSRRRFARNQYKKFGIFGEMYKLCKDAKHEWSPVAGTDHGDGRWIELKCKHCDEYNGSTELCRL